MDRNPQRGCGTKTSDSYYLEGDISTGGPLWAWTWFLGDGLDHVLLVSQNQVPTRSVVAINPAATLVFESFVGRDSPFSVRNAEREQAYRYYLGKTRDVGSADHIGAIHYSPYAFAEETARYGPSRKITKQMAKVFAELFQEHGPFPMLFSHTLIPLFATEDHKTAVLRTVLECLKEIDVKGLWIDACWYHDEWGQYSSKGHNPGQSSFLVPILDFMNMLKTVKSGESMPFASWHAAKRLLDEVRYEDQIFGASWMTRVTYTLPEDGKEEAREEVTNDIPGIDILDLEEYEYEQRITQAEGAD